MSAADAIELEMDVGPRVVATDADSAIELDLVDRDSSCNRCERVTDLNDAGQCRDCYHAVSSDGPQTMTPFAAISNESSANAAAKRPTEWVAPSTRGDGGTSEDSHASDAGIAAIRQGREARKQREAEKVIQERADAEHARLEVALANRPILSSREMVAGAAAEGHGVLVGWRGKGDMTRAAIATVLASANLPAEWVPEAVSAEAQASRAIGTLKVDGYTVQSEKKGKSPEVLHSYEARWMVNAPNFGGRVGDKSGDIVLVVTLIADRLDLEGDIELGARVLADYEERIGSELCKSADITAWLQRTLVGELDAVRYGVGWYVPRKHAATANTLCQAFETAGWGAEDSWISPALPVATGEQLRTGLLRGLSAEVRDVMHDLAKERDVAKTRENRDDIGNKRASTFLGRLKAVASRVVAYGALIGADRVATMQATISDAIKVLESSLSEDDAAIVSRFQNVWAEIEMDRKANGGVL